MLIREFAESDWPQVWPIIQEVVGEGDTFALEPSMTAEQARAFWIKHPPERTVVAAEQEEVLGTAAMGPNRPGPGSHVATASFMVPSAHRGRGVATALCEDMLSWAEQQGYAGVQFNAVVETNRGAVKLYERLGFRIIGTVPGAFQHPELGRVGLHIMYCDFAEQ
ncbi:GNAT family N-acetyltransferase [Bounagaea algeriensis]